MSSLASIASFSVAGISAAVAARAILAARRAAFRAEAAARRENELRAALAAAESHAVGGVRESEALVRLVRENAGAVLWTAGTDARFTAISGAALAGLGLRADALTGAPVDELIAAHLLDDVLEGAPLTVETARGTRWLRHHVEPLRDDCGAIAGAVGVSLDVTALRATEQQLFEATHRDALTGLPNRSSFERRVEAAVADAARDEARFALLCVGIDRFNTINDTLGRGTGDLVLREVGVRLQELLRGGDVIARSGGDEFTILLPRVVHAKEMRVVAERVVRAFADPVRAAGRELFVDVSVGAAMYPDHGTSAEALAAHADSAMYRAKDGGGSRAAMFEPAMETESARRLVLENELRHAIARGELRLLFQPVVDVATRRIVAAEALVRWHRDQDVIGPAAFVEIAEETGAIVAIDRWVLREACAAAGRIRAQLPAFRVAVNLSPRDLREPDLPDVVSALLAEHALPPDALSIEVTEHVLLDDAALPALRRLCLLGVQIAIDDFGVGYSSLACLKRLPVTALKIDRAFLREVDKDPYDQAIVRSIVGVADALGLSVTAEGVEGEDQLTFVRELGCEEAQGYLFAAPVSFDVLAARLAPQGGHVFAPAATERISPDPGREPAAGARYKSHE
jgi:diguanylate cyclase (GGDEF)-like protein/PAS domain S-box-containing protein